MFKKIVALIMAFVLLGCLNVFAQESKNSPTQEQIETVTSYKIFIGNENGDLMLDENVSRAQMCKILFAARGVKPKELSQENMFSDVNTEHWAYSYIVAAQDEKLIAGFPEGVFKPDENVKIQDAVKMIVCTLGYEELALAKGGYPTGYIVTAMQQGITKDVPFKLDKNATRGQIVKLIYNSLDVPIMQKLEYEDKTEYKMMNGKDETELITWRTMLEENKIKDSLLPMIAIDKEEVLGKIDLSEAQIKKTGNQETYCVKYNEGNIKAKHIIFYNDIFIAFVYDFDNVQNAYDAAKSLREDMDKVFGEKTTYPQMQMTYGDYFDNIKDASDLKNGFKYFEDWTLAGTQQQTKYYKNWKPYLDEEQVKKIVGEKSYGRIDLTLVLEKIKEDAVSVSVKCAILP